MKLVSYLLKGKDRMAMLHRGLVYDPEIFDPSFPVTMGDFLQNQEKYRDRAQEIWDTIMLEKNSNNMGIPADSLQLLAPVPHPGSCRDGYAFRQHVATARRNRGVPMLAEFDEYPVFYFTNHHSVQGPGDISCMADHFEKLDFELEVAVVICKEGRNIPADKADGYIGGLMIMNDISARTLQMEEMLLNLGPAKGKDFSTVVGPWLVTLEELAPYEIPCKPNHTGKNWNLTMVASVNGKKVSEGNLGDMHWTFAEIIERASYGATLYPGDIIGSGTVGTGCFLELNGTGRLKNPDYQEQWLQEGDLVELSVDGLGVLKNRIIKESDYSILKNKKRDKQPTPVNSC